MEKLTKKFKNKISWEGLDWIFSLITFGFIGGLGWIFTKYGTEVGRQMTITQLLSVGLLVSVGFAVYAHYRDVWEPIILGDPELEKRKKEKFLSVLLRSQKFCEDLLISHFDGGEVIKRVALLREKLSFSYMLKMFGTAFIASLLLLPSVLAFFGLIGVFDSRLPWGLLVTISCWPIIALLYVLIKIENLTKKGLMLDLEFFFSLDSRFRSYFYLVLTNKRLWIIDRRGKSVTSSYSLEQVNSAQITRFGQRKFLVLNLKPTQQKITFEISGREWIQEVEKLVRDLTYPQEAGSYSNSLEEIKEEIKRLEKPAERKASRRRGIVIYIVWLLISLFLARLIAAIWKV